MRNTVLNLIKEVNGEGIFESETIVDDISIGLTKTDKGFYCNLFIGEEYVDVGEFSNIEKMINKLENEIWRVVICNY